MKLHLKQKDLTHLVSAFVIQYQKGIDSATDNGDQSRTPEADDADTGGIYYSEG